MVRRGILDSAVNLNKLGLLGYGVDSDICGDSVVTVCKPFDDVRILKRRKTYRNIFIVNLRV